MRLSYKSLVNALEETAFYIPDFIFEMSDADSFAYLMVVVDRLRNQG